MIRNIANAIEMAGQYAPIRVADYVTGHGADAPERPAI